MLFTDADIAIAEETQENSGIGNFPQTDLYQVLGVHPVASQREIGQAYKKMLEKLDPSKSRQRSLLDESTLREELELVEEAYKTLGDKQKRLVYHKAFYLTPEMKEALPSSFFKSISGDPSAGRVNKPISKKSLSIYQDFFGFSEKPFHLTPDPKYLYLSAKHKEMLTQLVFGLQENNGFLEITGEVGTGKTLICRSFLNELHATFSIAYIIHPCLNALELLQTINAELGLHANSKSRKTLIDTLNHFLLEERKKSHRVVVIIDEAQNLSAPVLEELRLLSNMETETEKLIQIVLIGQPELDKLLSRRELRQLRQRITIKWELLPLDQEETRGYIEHRLNVANGKGKVQFSRAAAKLIYRYSQGIPRMINVLCDRGLLIAFTKNSKKVDPRTVHKAASYLSLPLPGSWLASMGRILMATLVGLAGVTLAYDFYPDMNRALTHSGKKGDIKRIIKKNPIDLSDPGELIPQRPAALSSPVESLEGFASSVERPVADLITGQQVPSLIGVLQIDRPETFAAYLSGMSMTESLAQSLRWVLQSWGTGSADFSGLTPSMFERLEKEYGFSIFEMNGGLKRLTALNQPAILEITLPNFQGNRYVALTAVHDGTGSFGSADRMEMSLQDLDLLWSRKSIILWKNFENLPAELKRGSRGEQVVWLQESLGRFGFFFGEAAPSYGPKTVEAVAEFQKLYGLSATGRFTAESQIMMYNLLDKYSTPSLIR